MKMYFQYIKYIALTKYKIHEMYFNYVFQLLVFQLLYNTEHSKQ